MKLSPQTTGSTGLQALSDAGITGALGASNTEIGYMDIPDMKYMPISSLDSELTRGDPRRDPYLTSISSLFKSGESDLVYLPANRSLSDYHRILQGMEELRDSELMDRRRTSFPFFSLIFLAVALVLIRASGTSVPRAGRLAAALPLAFMMIYLDSLRLFPLLLVFALSPSLLWIGRIRRGHFKTVLGFLGYVSAAFSLYRGLGGLRALELTLALVVGEIMLIAMIRSSDDVRDAELSRMVTRKKNPLRRRDHSLFEPVSLLRTPPVIRLYRNYFLEFAAAVLLILTFAVPVRMESAHTPLPSAASTSIGFSDISAIHSLENSRSVGSLPDLSQLLASVAYQEGFMYGAEFRLPLPDDELRYVEYTGNGSGILSSEQAVAVYNADWYMKTVQRELSRGPGLLFATLGGPVSISAVTRRTGIADYRFKPAHVGFSGLAFLISLFFIFSPTMPNRISRSHYFPLFITRRRAQAA